MKVLFIFIPILILFFSGSSFAQITINAASGRWDDTRARMVFRDNVSVHSETDNFTLNTDELWAYYVKAEDGSGDLSRINSYGNVNLKGDDLIASSNNMDIDRSRKIIRMSGDVKVWRGKDYMECDNLRLDYQNKAFTANKGTEQIKVIIHPGTR